MHRVPALPKRSRAGMTLLELMIAVGVMAFLAYVTSMIYFSVLSIYNQRAWKLPPYDAATAAMQRVTHDLRGAMQIHSHAAEAIVAIVPQKDAYRENVLALGADNQYYLVQGDYLAIYLSDQTGSLAATGNCLWEAVKPQGQPDFIPRVKIAENIHPELNPLDPNTGLPRAMFTFWPDETHLWGVEVWMTSRAMVHGRALTQTAHSESFLRNL